MALRTPDRYTDPGKHFVIAYCHHNEDSRTRQRFGGQWRSSPGRVLSFQGLLGAPVAQGRLA